MLARRFAHPGTSGQIIRRVWEDVRKNHVEKMFTEFPQLERYYSVSDHQMTLPTTPPSTILFGYAENEKDVKRKSVGPEYMDIFVDQAEQFTEAELKLIKTSCRWPDTPEYMCKFGLFFNPGGPGASFLRRVFKTAEYHEREMQSDYAFIQAYGWDNVEWVRPALAAEGCDEQDYYGWTDAERFAYFVTRSQYGRELNALPQHMRIGNLLGDFDNFAGQYFDIFDVAKHVKSCTQISEWVPRWIGIDWGHAHDAAVYWNAREGKVKTYREFVRDGLSPKALAQMIVDETPEPERKHVDAIYLSHDAFQERTTTDTIALQMGTVFEANGMPRPRSSDRDVVGGAALLYELLRSLEWEIDPSCVKLIECLPVVSRDENNREKTVKFEGDDPFDAIKYAMKGRLGETQAPLEVRILPHITATDLTLRAQQIKHFTHVEQKQTQNAPWVPRRRWAR